MSKMRVVSVSILILVALSSCTTMKAVPSGRAIDRFIDLYNSGDTERMTRMTSIPMLVDGEIVARKGDAEFFWTRLSEAGFSFENSDSSYSVERVDQSSFLLFGNTMEVRTFFTKYVPETAVIVRLKGPGGDFILLLSGRKGLYPFIFGFTGPVL